MAKNSKGQTVSNKKRYKKDSTKKTTETKKKTTAKKTTTKKTTPTKKTTTKKTTPKKSTVKKTTTKKSTVKKTTPKKKTTTVKKTTPKKTTPKKTTPKKETQVVEKQVLENNVSIVVDDKEEKLNYNIIEEVNVKDKKKTSNKIKTNFNDDLLDELESETIVNEAFEEEEKETNEDKNYIEEIKEEIPVEDVKPLVEETIEEISKFEENKSKEEEHLEEEIAYNGFVIRLIVLVLILILSIFFVIKFCVKYINTSPMKDVSYFESSDVSYTLCTNDNCNSDTVVSNSINKASIKFDYDVSFDDTVSYDVKYKIVEKFNIISSNGNVKTTTNDVLKKEIAKNKVEELEIEKEIMTDIGKYRNELSAHNKENNVEDNANVVVTLIIDGINSEKEVASIKIPLSESKVQTSIISSNVSDALFKDDTMNNYSNLYVILFGVSLLVVIFACIGVVVLINSSDNKVGE